MRLSAILVALAIAIGGVVLGAWRFWPFSTEVIEPIDCSGWNTEEFFKKITVSEISGCLAMGADVRARDTDGITPLFWALDAPYQDPDVVAVLLTAGADANEQLSIGGVAFTPLLAAAQKQPGASVLGVLLEAGADAAFRGGPKGRAALHWAANRGDVEAVSVLLEHGAQANVEDDDGETPLSAMGERFARSWDHHGRIANHIWTIRALLQHGADAADLADQGWTEVHTIALMGDNPDELGTLLDQGFDLTAETSSGWQASHLAALANEDSRIISTLLELGVNPNSTIGEVKTIELQRQRSESRFRPSPDVRIGDGRTPLHCAAFGNPNPDVIVALIEGGANPNAETTIGWTPLHAAVYANPSRDVVEALLEGGANANSQLEASWTWREVSSTDFMSAAEFALETDILLPLEGGNIHVKGRSTPLHVAVKYPQEDSAVGVLIRGGADSTARNVNGETPLHQVKTAADAVLVMEAGADPNARDEHGFTPLHDALILARGSETVELVSALIDGEANPNARTASGATPLHFLVDGSSWSKSRAVADLISLLIRHGTDPNSQDDYGNTPLHIAADSGATKPGMAEALIGGGADPNVRNAKGQSPLFNAVVPSRHYLGVDRDQHVVVRRLVELGAEPNLQDEKGRTPLHRALSHFSDFDPDDHDWLDLDQIASRPGPYSDEPTIDALLDAGADVTLADQNGVTPWDIAQESQALKGTNTFWRLNEVRFD